ncbi:MAG: hypothetical protein EOO92_11740 [Pedobacter sp.]|nr:MAG: hypothetical protein EOO92_11740 [Pedobacter sp.]
MTVGKTITNVNILPNELKSVKELVYDNCGFELTNLNLSTESLEYGACSFELNKKKIQFRVAKITPLKTGQFVTIWKRNKDGITKPFDISDDLDFIIIAAKKENNFGQFIFPKLVLAEKGIITVNNKEGKRGIRVYAPWDTVTNKQAKKTQTWQTKYFLTIGDENSINMDLMIKKN